MRVEYTVDLGGGRAKQPAQGLTRPEVSNSRLDRQQRLARLLALAHHFDYMIHTGQAADLAELARMTGVSRARISQIMDLLLLAPDIQGKVLDGSISLAAHDFRRIVQIAEWKRQQSLLSLPI